MLKKIYYYLFAAVQIILNISIFVKINEHAQDFLLGMQEAFNTYPEEMAKQMTEIFTLDIAKSFLSFGAAISILMMLIFLILVIFNREVKRKWLSIVVIAVTIFFGISDIGLLMAIVALVLICREKKITDDGTKEEKVIKEKKVIQKLRPLKVGAKDLGLGALLIFAYLSQFVLSEINMPKALMITSIIAYYVLIFAFVFYVFNKRFKRDFGAFRDNFGTYVKYIFKMWGVMLLCSVAAVVIQSLLGTDSESANQAALQSAPMWYVIPLAVVWAPIVEEALFRGVIRRFIPNNNILFIIVSAVSFGLIHTVGQEATLYLTFVQSIQYMAMGGVMAYAYTKTNNICTNMGVHFVQNSFSSIMMLLMNLI